MWICPKCGKSVKDSLNMCRNCGAANRSAKPAASQPEPQLPEPQLPEPQLPEPQLPEPPDFQEAADFHQEVDSRQESAFPGISTSSDGSDLPHELDWLKQYDQGPKPKIGPSWVCPGCGETVEGNFGACWKCQTTKEGEEPPYFPPKAELPEETDGELDRELDRKFDHQTARNSASWPSQSGTQARFRYFRDKWKSWDELFQEAADFATTLGPQRLISISHSADQLDGVVTVWYWAE